MKEGGDIFEAFAPSPHYYFFLFSFSRLYLNRVARGKKWQIEETRFRITSGGEHRFEGRRGRWRATVPERQVAAEVLRVREERRQFDVTRFSGCTAASVPRGRNSPWCAAGRSLERCLLGSRQRYGEVKLRSAR